MTKVSSFDDERDFPPYQCGTQTFHALRDLTDHLIVRDQRHGAFLHTLRHEESTLNNHKLGLYVQIEVQLI